MIWLSAFVVVFGIITHAWDDTSSTVYNNTSNLTNPSHDNNQSKDDSPKIPLYLGGYFTLGGIWDGSGILPAVEMALDHINERLDILPEYELKMVWNDTRCDSGIGTRMLFDQLFHEPQKILILGPPCSTDAQSVADAAHHWNLISVSYSAASPALSNRQKYRYFYRTCLNALSYNPPRTRLVQEFSWNRVALIRESHEVFSLTFEDLAVNLIDNNITIISSENFDKDPTTQLANLKNHDAKIIFADMYENNARIVLCEAYLLNMTNADYVWFIPEWYSDNWWAVEESDISCSVEEMIMALHSATYIMLSELFLSQNDEPTISGLTPQQFIGELQERMNRSENLQYTWSKFSPYGYDAAWAVALMLNASVKVLKEDMFSDGQRSLEDFTYADSEMAQVFFKLLAETDFTGISGPVSFKGGDREGITSVKQLQVRCEEQWHLHKGQCYTFVLEPLPFAEGELLCKENNAHLVSLFNDDEMMFLTTQWENLNLTWSKSWLIGLKFDDSSKTYFWSQQKLLLWQPKGNSPLSSSQAGDCMFLDFESLSWTPTSCDSTLPFICQTAAELFKQPVALYSAKDNNLIWQRQIKWPGGSIPLDHTPQIDITVVHVQMGIDWLSFVGMITVASVGVLMAIFFLGFNLNYRTQRIVRMSSPNLNNLIIVGNMAVYLSIIAGGFDSSIVNRRIQRISCQVRVWLLSIGFVLAFGSMFSKTWRVYRVAALKTPKRVIITDNQLYLMVFSFFCVDVCVLTLWYLFDPLFVERIDLYERDDLEVANQRIQPFIEQCTSQYLIYWQLALYSFKGLLLIFGTFLAWETRQVTFPALNDSKLIGICVYNTVVLCIVGVAVSFIITNDPTSLFIFTSSIVAFCATLTLVVLFIPKIISVYKNPKGLMSTPTIQGSIHASNSHDKVRGDPYRMENKKLRCRIIELEKALRRQPNSNNVATWVVNGVSSATMAIDSTVGETSISAIGSEDHGRI